MDIIRNKYVEARRRRKLKRQQNGTDNATWGWSYTPGNTTLTSAKFHQLQRHSCSLLTRQRRDQSISISLLNKLTEDNMELHQRKQKIR